MSIESFFSRKPALRFVLLLIAGILSAQYLRISSSILYWCLACSFLATLLLLVSSSARLLASLGLQGCVVGLGILLQSAEREHLQSNVLHPSVLDERVRIDGVVETEPIRQGTKSSFSVHTQVIERNSGTKDKGKRVLVYVKTANSKTLAERLRVGTSVEFQGILQSMPRARNPGDFDFGRYLELNDVQGIVFVSAESELGIRGEGQSDALTILVATIQRKLYKILDEFHSENVSGFLKGVIFGYRADISLEVKRSFVDTGTIHILAVSGSNVAVVALIFYSVFSLFRFSRRLIVLASIAGLVLFTLVTGSSPSVVRATIMASVILSGSLFERKPDIYNSLSVAAIAILLWNTNNLFDVGFQLSFAAVISIVYFYPILVRLINKIPERYEEIKILDAGLKLLAVSLAAQIGTLPFTAYYFGRVSLVSLLANLVVVPVSGINVLVGFAEIASSFVSVWTAHCYVAVNDFLVWFLLGFVKFASQIPYAYVEAASLHAYFPVFYYVGVVGLFNADNPKVMKKFILALLVLANGVVVYQLVTPEEHTLKVTVLDVGQGDAILVEFPNNNRMLIDAGPRSLNYDAGERIVQPFLKRQGISVLDLVIVTHGHSDHIGGIPYLLGHTSVRRFLETGSSSDSKLYSQMMEAALRTGAAVQKVHAGDRIVADATTRMYALHPRMPQDSTANLNNLSVAIKLVYGSTSLLLVGDAEDRAEAKMATRYGPFLKSQILKVGHHGSNTSSTQEFLDRVHPSTALVSVAMKNKFHHPSSAVIQRFRAMGSKVLQTNVEGAVVLESDGTRWKRVHWRENKIDQ